MLFKVVLLLAVCAAPSWLARAAIDVDNELDEAVWTHATTVSVAGTVTAASPHPDVDTLRVARAQNGDLLVAMEFASGQQLFDSGISGKVSFFIDTDGDRSTGYHTWLSSTAGFDLLLERTTWSSSVYEHTGVGNGWSWSWRANCVTDSMTTSSSSVLEWRLAAECVGALDFATTNGFFAYVIGSDESEFNEKFEVSTSLVSPASYGADSWALYYGAPSVTGAFDALARYGNVVVHPPAATPQFVADLQAAGVNVLCYISVGEEPHNSAQHTGTGSATWTPAGGITANSDNLADYYIDGGGFDAATEITAPDGTPDVNGQFGGRFVYPTATWRARLKSENGATGAFPGYDQLLQARTTDANGAIENGPGNNYGCSGLFLDTLDTAGPFWSPGYYGWTVSEFHAVPVEMKSHYPSAHIMANRGLTMFNAQEEFSRDGYTVATYNAAFVDAVDSVLFESLYVTSSQGFPSPYAAEHEWGLGPKLQRTIDVHSFDMVALDYRVPWQGEMYARTDAQMDEALDLSFRKFGWSSFHSVNSALNDLSLSTNRFHFAADTQAAESADVSAPTWQHSSVPTWTSTTTSAREGAAGVTCRYVGSTYAADIFHDGASDRSGVSYVVLRSTADDVAGATEVTATTTMNAAWATKSAHADDTIYPLQSTVDQTESGTFYYWVRVEDAAGNRDTNTVSVTCTFEPATVVVAANTGVDIVVQPTPVDIQTTATAPAGYTEIVFSATSMSAPGGSDPKLRLYADSTEVGVVCTKHSCPTSTTLTWEDAPAVTSSTTFSLQAVTQGNNKQFDVEDATVTLQAYA